MDDIDEYMDLPEDPELAFVEYVRRRQKEVQEGLREASYENSDVDEDDVRMKFVGKVMAFHKAHDFTILEDPGLERGMSGFYPRFDKFNDQLVQITTEISIRHARRLKPITTILTIPDDIRDQIHNRTEEIRQILIKLNLKENKKEALLDALNNFSHEVDKDRTKLESWTTFGIQLASAGGQMAKELAPVKELFDSVGNLLGKAKELADRAGLPSPNRRKQIESPPKKLPKPDDEPPPDDEIPF